MVSQIGGHNMLAFAGAVVVACSKCRSRGSFQCLGAGEDVLLCVWVTNVFQWYLLCTKGILHLYNVFFLFLQIPAS